MTRRPISAWLLSALLHVRGQLLVQRRPPTVQELGALLRISARAAHGRLKRLEAAGYVRRPYAPGGKRLSRALQLVDVDGAGDPGANGGPT